MRADSTLPGIFPALVIALGYATTPAFAEGETPIPAVLQKVDVVENLGAQIPADLTFLDQDNHPVRLADRFNKGRPIIVVLAWYRCPMLCPMVLSGAARALPANGPWHIGKDFDALTVSFAPEETPHDAGERRREHLSALGASLDSNDWPFLTGDKSSIARLSQALGFRYAYDEATKQYAHAAAIFVLTPEGKVSRYVYGVEYSPRDLRLALAEAGNGRVGPSVDRVLLTCFRYNPASRQYAFFINRFLQIGGLLVFLTFGLVLTIFWRRELLAMRSRRGAP